MGLFLHVPGGDGAVGFVCQEATGLPSPNMELRCLHSSSAAAKEGEGDVQQPSVPSALQM